MVFSMYDCGKSYIAWIKIIDKNPGFCVLKNGIIQNHILLHLMRTMWAKYVLIVF